MFVNVYSNNNLTNDKEVMIMNGEVSSLHLKIENIELHILWRGRWILLVTQAWKLTSGDLSGLKQTTIELQMTLICFSRPIGLCNSHSYVHLDS